MARPYQKLRGLMREYDYSQGELAEVLELDARTLNRKINLTGSCWTVNEMYAIMSLFHVPYEQMHILFPFEGRNEIEGQAAYSKEAAHSRYCSEDIIAEISKLFRLLDSAEQKCLLAALRAFC